MSPEMIQNRSYDYKIDIWALGILLFEMIAGQAPFRGESPEEVLNQMKTKIFFCERFGTAWSMIENEEIGLIKMILRVTPHKRPTVH
jgi:serine/threonine protein kinase